jgi:hypothetical protein
LISTDSLSLAAAIRKGKGALVSPGAVTLNDAQLGFAQGLLAKDPDGHGVQLVTR